MIPPESSLCNGLIVDLDAPGIRDFVLEGLDAGWLHIMNTEAGQVLIMPTRVPGFRLPGRAWRLDACKVGASLIGPAA